MAETIMGATVIKTGFTRGSGYDKIYLKTLDNRIFLLEVEKTRDDDICIGLSDVKESLNKKIKSYKETIKNCQDNIKYVEELLKENQI